MLGGERGFMRAHQPRPLPCHARRDHTSFVVEVRGSPCTGDPWDTTPQASDTTPYGKRDLLYGRRDLSYGKRDLSYGKRDLSYGKRDLSYGKRDLSYGKRDLSQASASTYRAAKHPRDQHLCACVRASMCACVSLSLPLYLPPSLSLSLSVYDMCAEVARVRTQMLSKRGCTIERVLLT